MSRNGLLAGASAAAFVLAIGGAAMAAQATVPDQTGGSNTVSGHVAVSDLLTNTNASSSATQSSSSVAGTATGSGDTISVSVNTIGAVTIGNSVLDTVDFGTTSVGPGTSAGSGIGILSMSLNSNRAFTASTTNSSDALALNGGSTGTYTVDSNLTEASVTLNTSSITVTPTGVPLNFASASSGGISTQYPASPLVTTTGDITVVNSQGNLSTAAATNSSAIVRNGTASLTIGQAGATGGNVSIGGTQDISHNSFSASFTENQATNAAGASAGDLPSLQGSITVANVQANQDSGNGGPNGLAYANTDWVMAEVFGNANLSGSSATETLTGALTNNSNSVGASATGNSAVGATAGSGNTVTLSGVNYADPGGQTQANSIAYPGVGIATTTNAGLALLNSQTQETTGGTVPLNATNYFSRIVTEVENAAGATSQQNSNSITSAATGDTAYNAISVTGADSIDGSASLGSAQEVNHTQVAATTNIGGVQSYLAYAPGPTYVVTGTNAAVDSNTIGSTAYGASVTNAITLDANSVATGSATTVLTASRPSADAQSFDASNTGATIANVQAVFGGDSFVTALAIDPTVSLFAGYDGPALTGDSFSVDKNEVQAIAAGASGGSAASVGGSGGQASSFTGGLGVLNGQSTAAQVTAAVENIGGVALIAGQRGADVGGAGSGQGSTLDISGNVVRALAYGTQATGNTASVDAGSIRVAANADNSSAITVTPADSLGLFFDHASTPAAEGGVAVLSDQSTTASVSASVLGEGEVVLAYAGGNLIDSSVSGDANAFIAAARGNAGVNGVTLAGDAISTLGGAQGPIATVANVQSVGRSTAVSTQAENPFLAGLAEPVVWVHVLGSVSGSTADASSNTMEALTVGNTATNSLAATAGSAILAASGGATTGATYAGGVLTNQASFAVTNAQGSGVFGGRDANADYTGVQIQVGANLANSTATADGNATLASSTDNAASNGLTLNATSIQATGAVQSLQLSNTSLTDIVGGADNTGVIVRVGDLITASTIDNSNNSFSAEATGNTAANTLKVTAVSASAAAGAVPVSSQGAIDAPASRSAAGDFALENIQQSGGNGITTSSTGTDSIVDSTSQTGGTDSTTFSTLTVSGNSNQAVSHGNVATNAVGLAVANSSGVTAALLSDQAESSGFVDALAYATALSDLLVGDSTVAVTGNSNLGLGVANSATNTLTAGGAGASLGPGYGGPAGSAGGANAGSDGAATPKIGASADYALANVQTSNPPVQVLANQTVGNSDTPGGGPGLSTGSVYRSTVTLGFNSDSAQGTANLAFNSLTLTPSARLAADAGLVNAQGGDAAVGIFANGIVAFSEPNVQSSTIAVVSNTSSATAMDNASTNTLAVSAADIQLTGAAPLDPGTRYLPGTAIGGLADYALTNLQSGGNASKATATGGFSISETAPTAGATVETTNSTLKVDGNATQAAANANVTANTLTIAAGADAVNGASSLAHAPTGALLSVQTASTLFDTISSSTAEAVSATGIVSLSTVDMSSNSNLALSIANDATNSLAASAVNYASGGNNGVGNLYAVATPTSVSADLALENVQQTSGTQPVAATATTTIRQSDSTAVAGTAVVNQSTITVENNTTTAASTVNRASDTLTFAATNAGALGAISNLQTAAANASAAATVTIGYAEPSAAASTIALNSNSSTAQAAGNSSSNVLNATASANYSIPSGASASTVDASNLAQAQYVVLNDQSESNAVTATNGTNVTVGLTGAAGAGVVTSSTVSVSGNTALAQSTGNAAANAVGLSAAATGTAPAAISSLQFNIGVVSATVSGSSAAVTAGGPGSVTGSTITVNTNVMIARATGNSAVNTITAK